MKELPSSRSFYELLKRKKRMAGAAAGTFLAAVSIAIGTAIVPSDFEVPVLLANGEVITPPWYVTVGDTNVALVDSEEEAREVVEKVADTYKNEKTVDIEIEEKTSPQEMPIKNGDEKPTIQSVDEAVKKITKEKEMTVVTTEVVTDYEPIKFDEVEKKTDDLYIGQKKVQTKGEDGLKEVTKEVTKENGKAVDAQVKEEVLLEKPKEQVILTGTKEYEEGEAVLSRSAVRGTGQLAQPVATMNITSSFGPRWGRQHRGVDLGLPIGSPIYAADGGTVVHAGYSGSYGNLVKIDHGNGMMTYYAHCSAFVVSQGQKVKRGQQIAKVGSTGNSTGPHLHFEVLLSGNNVNPMNYL